MNDFFYLKKMASSVDLYYYATSQPLSSAVACPDWNSQKGAPVSAIQQVPYVPTIWKITYQIQELTFYILNWLLTMYTSSAQITGLINAVTQATNVNRSVYIPSYRDLNMDTLNSLRYNFCFMPEPLNLQYCPEIPRYNSASDDIKCSRVVSTNRQYNNSMDSTNKVRCSLFYTELTDPTSDRYADASAMFRQYCMGNPDSYDCQCYARAQKNLYKQTKDAMGGVAVNDVCWYKPCSYQTNIFVPPELLNAPANCPSACANVIIVDDVKGRVNIDNVSMNNDCFQAANIQSINIPSTPNPATNAMETVSVSNTPSLKIISSFSSSVPISASVSPSESLVKKEAMKIGLIVLGGFLVIIVLLIIIGWFAQRRQIGKNQKNDQKPESYQSRFT